MDFGLVQSSMLYGLLGLSIPYIIHLIFRQKPRNVVLGSIRFVRQVTESRRRQRKVMKWLLLALRMACIALLALMFARPFSVAKDPEETDEQMVVVLIDRSASMQLQTNGRRLIDIAVEQALQIAGDAASSTRIEIAWFDQKVTPLTGNSPDQTVSTVSRDELIRLLEAPTSMYGTTSFAPALDWARDICTASRSTRQELHIITDLQQTGLVWSSVAPMPQAVQVTVHDVGRDIPSNLAVTRAEPLRNHLRPGETTTVEVSLLNDGPFTLDNIPVVLDLKNGTRTIHERKKIKLEPGSIEPLKFQLPELAAGLWQGTVVVEAIDDASFDNLRHLAIMATPQYPVLVVDGEPHEADFLSETFLLQTALRLAAAGESHAASPYQPVRGNLADLSTAHTAVVLANVKTVDRNDAVRLREHVNDGGGLIVFSGNNVSSDGYRELSLQRLVPGEILSARESFQLPWRIDSWDKSHSIFEAFDDPQHGDLARLAFRGITEFVPAQDAVTLATFNDGKPFVVERPIGNSGGTVLWVTTACDNEWGSWGQSELYLPVVHQMLGHVTGLNAGGPVREQDAGLNSTATEPGVYRQGRHWHVANINSRESELQRCPVDDFVNRFALNTSGHDPLPVQVASIDAAFNLSRNEAWHWLLIALFVVGSVEFFVANRSVV